MNQDEYEITIEKDQNLKTRRIITCEIDEGNIRIFESKILTPQQRATLAKAIGPAKVYIKTLDREKEYVTKVSKSTIRGGQLRKLLLQNIPSYKQKIRYILNKENQGITRKRIREAFEEYGNILPNE